MYTFSFGLFGRISQIDAGVADIFWYNAMICLDNVDDLLSNGVWDKHVP